MKKVVILNFSSRNNGNCSKICDNLLDYYKQTSVRYYMLDKIRLCTDCNYECLRAGAVCPNVTKNYKKMMDDICDSDLVYYVVPNFCGYPCGRYFAFNERSAGYFNLDTALMQKYMSVKKRFIIVSNSQSDELIKAMQQQTNESPDVLIMRSSNYGTRSIDGNMMDSKAAIHDLTLFLEEYCFA